MRHTSHVAPCAGCPATGPDADCSLCNGTGFQTLVTLASAPRYVPTLTDRLVEAALRRAAERTV